VTLLSPVLLVLQVLLHTRVPLIKAEAKIYVNQTTGQTFAEETEGAECIEISLDISIDGPEHSGTYPFPLTSLSLSVSFSSLGLATTAVTETMLRELPGIGPVATLLKEYLKTKVPPPPLASLTSPHLRDSAMLSLVAFPPMALSFLSSSCSCEGRALTFCCCFH
jgi:hypothetical protein